MVFRSACRGLLILLLSLAFAPAWGGGQAIPMEAEAPMSDVFETLAGAGVISEQLHAPMVMVFNHRGQLAFTMRGRAPEGVLGQVEAALRDSDADRPEGGLEELTSRYFPATSPSRDGGAILLITMEAHLCPPCEDLAAEYVSALETLPRETEVLMYVLTIQRDR